MIPLNVKTFNGIFLFDAKCDIILEIEVNMKKVLNILLFLVLIVYFCGCGPKKYIITLQHNENITKIEVLEGTAFFYDEIVEENYIFMGWFDQNNMDAVGKVIYQNETFVGKYIKIGTTYNINYILNGGELRVYAPLVYEVGKITKLVNPLPIGKMSFLGWYLNGEKITEISDVTYGDITLEAKWEDYNIYHTVEYVLNNGVLQGEYVTTFIEGLANYYLPIPKKEGYLFKGWYTEETFENRIFSITIKTNVDLTLYAKFEKADTNNMYISFLGDSITTYIDNIPSIYPSYYPTQGCDVNSVEKTWWHQVIANTNYKLLMNNSYSGSKVTSGDGCGQSIERIQNLSLNNESPDIIIIHMGTNDLTHRIPVSNFETAYRNMIKIIRQQCDDAIIFVCNLPSMKHQGFLDTRLAYNETINKIAIDEGLILIDIAKLITEDNYANYLFAGAHPNALGMKLMSDEVIKKLNELK